MASNTADNQESEDSSLRMLNARRMLEFRRRAKLAAAKELERTAHRAEKAPSDRDVVLKSLVERGDEVLKLAEASYPEEIKVLIPKLADLIREQKITSISGGELLQFFRAIGLRVSVATSISVEQHGKFVSLSEKLKTDSDNQ